MGRYDVNLLLCDCCVSSSTAWHVMDQNVLF